MMVGRREILPLLVLTGGRFGSLGTGTCWAGISSVTVELELFQFHFRLVRRVHSHATRHFSLEMI